MGSYFYLVSQLPYVIFGQTPPMSSAAFRDLAKSLLDETDGALIDMLELDPQPPKVGDEGPSYAESAPPSGSAFIDNWREWERTLRLNLARYRAFKVKRDNGAPVEPPMFPTDAAATAVKAMSVSESPLDVEIFIDKARWNAVEEMQGSEYFSLNTILAYLLKLILLERRTLFNAEEGFSEYKSLYASILEGVQLGVSPVGEPK